MLRISEERTSGAEVTEYRIDDLAQAGGTTSRNVRLYQERGLLPGPVRREGRANIYDDSHLARLRIIDGLLARGFTIAHIADFITSWETGKDLSEVLGLQNAVTAAWGNTEEPLELSRDTVDAFLTDPVHGPVTDQQLDRLRGLGLLRTKNDGETVELTRPRLLEMWMQLQYYGIGLPTLIDLYSEIRNKLDDIAGLMVVTAKDHIVSQHGVGWLPESDRETAEATRMLNHWRELGTEIVHSGLDDAFDNALSRELGGYLEAAARKYDSH